MGSEGVRLHGLAWGRSEGVRLAVGVRPLGSSARTLAQGSSAWRPALKLFSGYWLHWAERRAGLRQERDLSPTVAPPTPEFKN